jgi:malate dehydrogenase (decarboxylating)
MHGGLKQLCRYVRMCGVVILCLLTQSCSVAKVVNPQFEDFQMKWAFETLQRYRNRFCMFNDDVQVR